MNPRITVGTYSITWDDAWHRIEVNGYIQNLSPTQYRIWRAFLSAWSSSTNGIPGELVILAHKSIGELQEETELSRQLLSKHIYDLNGRIIASGLHITSFRDGYILTFSRSVEKVR